MLTDYLIAQKKKNSRKMKHCAFPPHSHIATTSKWQKPCNRFNFTLAQYLIFQTKVYLPSSKHSFYQNWNRSIWHSNWRYTLFLICSIKAC